LALEVHVMWFMCPSLSLLLSDLRVVALGWLEDGDPLSCTWTGGCEESVLFTLRVESDDNDLVVWNAMSLGAPVRTAQFTFIAAHFIQTLCWWKKCLIWRDCSENLPVCALCLAPKMLVPSIYKSVENPWHAGW
jgi:hypothetical protein